MSEEHYVIKNYHYYPVEFLPCKNSVYNLTKEMCFQQEENEEVIIMERLSDGLAVLL